MKFSEIIGNTSVAKTLASMADSGRVAHAMLLYENDGCGALALALAYSSISLIMLFLNKSDFPLSHNKKSGDTWVLTPAGLFRDLRLRSEFLGRFPSFLVLIFRW